MSKIWVVIITAIVSIAIAGGGTYYYLNNQAESNKADLQSQINELNNQIADSQSQSSTVEEASETVGTEVISHDIQITYDAEYDKGRSKAYIKNNGVEAGAIEMTDYFVVHIQKQTRDYVYLRLQPEGVGGYILYDLMLPVYRMNLVTNKIEMLSNEGGTISPSERYLAYTTEKDGQYKIIIKNIETGEPTEYKVPSKYGRCGDLTFSPNETKLAYAAAVGDPNNEKGDVFIIDLKTAAQTQANATEITGRAPEVHYWYDNDSLNYY